MHLLAGIKSVGCISLLCVLLVRPACDHEPAKSQTIRYTADRRLANVEIVGCTQAAFIDLVREESGCRIEVVSTPKYYVWI